MVKVVRAHSTDGTIHMFSIVADDKGFQYAFAKGNEFFDGPARVKRLTKNVDKKKMNVDEYLRLAAYNLSMYKYDTPIEEDGSVALAAKLEKLYIEKSLTAARAAAGTSSPIDKAVGSIDQVFYDYPNLMDQMADYDAEIDSEAMTNLVLSALGEIDPKGPNGWLLDYLDGKEPAEGTLRMIDFSDNSNTEGKENE